MTAHHYSNSQNSMISFWHVDFEPKIFLILYPSLENSTTGIAIMACPPVFSSEMANPVEPCSCSYRNLINKHDLHDLMVHFCLFWSKMSTFPVMGISELKTGVDVNIYKPQCDWYLVPDGTTDLDFSY